MANGTYANASRRGAQRAIVQLLQRPIRHRNIAADQAPAEYVKA